jgi:hypothetical protein
MAPEQARGGGDSLSDLYSAGAVLWELLVATPFSADAVNQLEFESGSGWNELFALTLALDPSQRAASARELSAILAPFAVPMRDKANRAMSGLVNAISPRVDGESSGAR